MRAGHKLTVCLVLGVGSVVAAGCSSPTEVMYYPVGATATAPTPPVTQTTPPPPTPQAPHWYCFEISVRDQYTQEETIHNSECVSTQPHCTEDLNEMKGRGNPNVRVSRTCFTQETVYCFTPTGLTDSLCYMSPKDCAGGRVTLSEDTARCGPRQ